MTARNAPIRSWYHESPDHDDRRPTSDEEQTHDGDPRGVVA
jgi:hypothetical protein